jgi:rfaE bifunctional protein nucleotidyltransferase chain/domain
VTTSRILTLSQLLGAAARERAAGRKIVFANGAFDLLHVGHVRYLQAAAEQGDWLVVGVNSDRSVAAAKGPGRPIVPERERAELVAALEGVDAVTIFDADSPRALIRSLAPDVHAKGTDYRVEDVPEREAVASYGGRTVVVGDPKDHSTSEVIEKIKSSALGSQFSVPETDD